MAYVDMTPYELIADKFAVYLSSRESELIGYKGMRQIQLTDANWDKIQEMKEDFCALHGINKTDINIRWALLKGITDYCLVCLCGEFPF